LKNRYFWIGTKTEWLFDVRGAAIGFDVSAVPTIDGDAVLESIVFIGALTTCGKYVNKYTTGTDSGLTFNYKWFVSSAGIPLEGDRLLLAPHIGPDVS